MCSTFLFISLSLKNLFLLHSMFSLSKPPFVIQISLTHQIQTDRFCASDSFWFLCQTWLRAPGNFLVTAQHDLTCGRPRSYAPSRSARRNSFLSTLHHVVTLLARVLMHASITQDAKTTELASVLMLSCVLRAQGLQSPQGRKAAEERYGK